MALTDALSLVKRPLHVAPNLVLSCLALGMLIAVWSLNPVSVAANRIVPGTSFDLLAAVGLPGAALLSLLLAVFGLFALWPSRAHYQALLAITILTLVLLPFGLMVAAYRLVPVDVAQARMGIGAAGWTLLFMLLLCLVELRLRLGLSRLLTLMLLLGVGSVWWLCLGWWLPELALVQEFQARSGQFMTAMAAHLTLVAVTVSVSVVLGMLLAMLMRRYARLQRVAFGMLNFLQTIPSLALFGLLLGPLAWLAAKVPLLATLGVSGIGTAPALIALIAYSLLPMVRNTYTALEGVDSVTLEAAKAMGMRATQRFWQVRFPLALPVVLEGVRITAVQAVGLTAVAALIGAGGLGTFIFQGLGQAAMDMVLLGALPLLLLALALDAGLGALADALRPGGQQ